MKIVDPSILSYEHDEWPLVILFSRNICMVSTVDMIRFGFQV